MHIPILNLTSRTTQEEIPVTNDKLNPFVFLPYYFNVLRGQIFTWKVLQYFGVNTWV